MAPSRSLPLLRLSFCFIASAIFATTSANCYLPTGESPDDTELFAPCNTNSTAVSMCCNIANEDRCTPEGLCLSGAAYYRDLCTDPTWQAPECVKMCLDISNPRMTLCGDGSWCCGADNNTCCDKDMGVGLPSTRLGTVALPFSVSTGSPGVVTSSVSQVTTTSSASSSVTASPPSSISSSSNSIPSSGSASSTSTTPSATSTTSPAAPVSKSTSKDNSTAIGAGVGVPLGVIIVGLALGFYFWRRRQNKKKAVELPDVEGASGGPSAGTALMGNHGNSENKGAAYMTSADSSPTRYGNTAIEDGGVMAALATGSPAVGSQQPAVVHPVGSGEIHEIDDGHRVHELPGEQHNPKNVYDYPGNEKI